VVAHAEHREPKLDLCHVNVPQPLDPRLRVSYKGTGVRNIHPAGAFASAFGKARHMFIAMNRFKVIPGSQADFERVWTTRDTHLREVPGFVEFHLLRGPEREDHVLFASHTIWRSRVDFEAWTKSEAFRLAHQSAGQNKPLYLGHPEFEGFEVIQTVDKGKS
jgi:heme-degrading monooxygenase HmoA